MNPCGLEIGRRTCGRNLKSIRKLVFDDFPYFISSGHPLLPHGFVSQGLNIHVLWWGTKRSCSTHFVSFRVLPIMSVSCLFRILLDQGLGVNSRASPYFNSDLYEKHKYATIMKMITIIIIQTLFLHKHPLFISTLGIL